jgi:acetolactate synthase-1/2/3 large subunit
MKVSDYIADQLVEYGFRHVFIVPGGASMYLMNSLGKRKELTCIFMQHEQAAAIAAEAYFRINNKPAIVCCTTGPGGTNTLTGVLGAWLDSIPLLVLSGQVKVSMMARATGLPLRSLGDQEFDIVSVAKALTKFAAAVTVAPEVTQQLKTALRLMTDARPGPVWLDIPIDVQSTEIRLDAESIIVPSSKADDTGGIPESQIDDILNIIRNAERPVLNIGNGIRIADAKAELDRAIELLRIPVVTGFNCIDLIEDAQPYYIGRAGVMGDRAGNWAVQNSDVLLSVGSRLSVRQVGFDSRTWAPNSHVIMVDIDESELTKPTIHVETPMLADAQAFFQILNNTLADNALPIKESWLETCQGWRSDFPVVNEQQRSSDGLVNIYHFVEVLSERLPEDSIVVVGNGSACVVCGQAFRIKAGQRYISNSGAASMGYDLPAAIGTCFAADGQEIICITGDGSMQMNIQELQTIKHHNLPIKLFVINNAGYHSMRQTQDNLFKDDQHFGIGPETNDISFPELRKIADAYGFGYHRLENNLTLDAELQQVLAHSGALICEIFVTTDQFFEPKSATKTHEDGTLISTPLEDLAPFLPAEIIERIMSISRLK